AQTELLRLRLLRQPRVLLSRPSRVTRLAADVVEPAPVRTPAGPYHRTGQAATARPTRSTARPRHPNRPRPAGGYRVVAAPGRGRHDDGQLPGASASATRRAVRAMGAVGIAQH